MQEDNLLGSNFGPKDRAFLTPHEGNVGRNSNFGV